MISFSLDFTLAAHLLRQAEGYAVLISRDESEITQDCGVVVEGGPT